MKILYLLSADPFEENGVNKKVKSQVDAWKSFGHEVFIYSILVNNGKQRSDNFLQSKIFKRKMVFFLPQNFKKNIKELNPDIVYCRFEIFKPFHWTILKKYRSVIEINSDDIGEIKKLSKTSLRNKIRYLYNYFTRWIFFKYAKGIVSVSYELLKFPFMNKYKKPSIVIPNNLILENFQTIKDLHSNIPQLVFMGTSNYEWHGIDKIIELARQTKEKLFFHIIGSDGAIYPKLSNVKFHGYLFREEYERIIRKCNIGISTLSLYKKDMIEASSIKLREYLAYGLPSIVGYTETAFINKQIPDWILQLPNSERNVIDNIDGILDFCYKMKDVIVTHNEINQYIDSMVIEKQKIEFFENIIKE